MFENYQIWYTTILLIAMTIVLIKEWADISLTVFAVLILLIIGNVINVKEAFSGFSNVGLLSIGLLFISTVILGTNTITAYEEENLLDNETYEYGFIVLDCNSISGLPENEHVGGLNGVDLTTNGLTQGIIFTIPVWGSAIVIENKEIQLHMDNFFGVSVSYSCGAGSIVGIGKNIQWNIIQ